MKDELKQITDKISALEAERNAITSKLETTETLDNSEISKLQTKFRELSMSIGNSKKEHATLNEKSQTVNYEDSTDKYSIKIPRDAPTIIDGFPNQTFSIRLSWTKPTENKARIQKTNIKKEEHSITIVS